jgi:hypothetical protein
MRTLRVVLVSVVVLAGGAAEAGGLFSRLKSSVNPQQPDPQPQQQMPQNVDCNQLASIPNAGMTVEQCRAMTTMAQGGQAAMNDPSGARPGDDQMSCADITAEMKTMSGVGVSQQHREQGNRAAGDFQSTMAKQQAEATAIAARESAEVTAAEAADTATEAATGGVVRGRSAYVLQQRLDAENKATGERMAKERAPKQQALMGSVVASGNDMTQSMQSNPRFARLMKLGMDKGCKGEGR